jgi:hypothetical protein
MIGLQSNKLNKERRLLMSAKTYSIESLLVGKSYRSRNRNFEGIIQEAETHDAWYGDNYQAYRVRVRPQHGDNPKSWGKDFYAVVAVKTGE